MVSGLCLEPGSILTGYQYSRSIDGDTFNQIKLVRDNKDAGKQEVYIAKDSETIRQWGLLQYYEKVDDGMNAEQIKEKADALLQLKNRVRQTLSLERTGRSVAAGRSGGLREAPGGGAGKVSPLHLRRNTASAMPPTPLKLI